MIHAEISIYPIGTSTTSASFYIAKAIESIKDMKVSYHVNAMGTILESNNIEEIYKAAKSMMEVVHNLGVNRVEVILKIDSRNDKQKTIQQKIDAINKYLKE